MTDEEAEFIAAVEEGLKALNEGRIVSHEEVKARFEKPILLKNLLQQGRSRLFYLPDRDSTTASAVACQTCLTRSLSSSHFWVIIPVARAMSNECRQ